MTREARGRCRTCRFYRRVDFESGKCSGTGARALPDEWCGAFQAVPHDPAWRSPDADPREPEGTIRLRNDGMIAPRLNPLGNGNYRR